MPKIHTLFISHGMPIMAIKPGPTHDFLKSLGRDLTRPKAILCVSAHWEAVRPLVSTSSEPETIHDFYGFPRPLHEMQYPTHGDPDLAKKAAALLKQAGFEVGTEGDRGLDHGAWAPLSLMYPEADIPVVQLSVQSDLDAAHHFKLGEALQPLREEGVLIMGSGGATHNLEEMSNHSADAEPPDYVADFDNWLEKSVTRGRSDTLIRFLEAGPSARRNHPFPAEHFLPLFVPLGAAGQGTPGRLLHRSFTYGVLSLAAYLWE